MNRKLLIILSTATMTIAPLAFFGTTMASWAVIDDANAFGMRIKVSDVKNVTFHTAYANNSWDDGTSVGVVPGSTISEIPSVSASGYTLLGWKTSAPTFSDYSKTYTQAQLSNLAITEDLEFWPVFESNNDYAYVDSTYYQANVEVTINSNSIGSTRLGKRYIGFEGIPNAVATWDVSRNLYSASGIYKFQNDNGGAMVYRKVGFKPNSSWHANWGSGAANIGIYTWDDSGSVSIHMGSDSTVYAFIPATYINFKFSRYTHDTSSFTWGNESSNLSFDNGWWWNNSGTNKYTSSTPTLSMNNWSSWVNNWEPKDATWVS